MVQARLSKCCSNSMATVYITSGYRALRSTPVRHIPALLAHVCDLDTDTSGGSVKQRSDLLERVTRVPEVIDRLVTHRPADRAQLKVAFAAMPGAATLGTDSRLVTAWTATTVMLALPGALGHTSPCVGLPQRFARLAPD